MSRSSYKPEFAEQAKKLCLLGATDAEVADFFEVAPSTLYLWKNSFPDFVEAMKTGKDEADERVERSLFQKAVGYELEVEELFAYQGSITRAKTRKYFPPDTVACIYWTKNRRPDRWRDVHKIEHGKPGDFSNMSDDELDSYIKGGKVTPRASNSREIKAQEQKAATRARRLN